MTPDKFILDVSCRRLALLSLILLVIPLSESAGQAEWRKTVKVIVPVEDGSVTAPLADSVVAMAEAGKIPIRRAPASDTTTLADAGNALSKEGLALTSATHVFITYRYNLTDGALQRHIRSLHFIYRPTAQQGEDIPILYVDLTHDNLRQELLVERGTPSFVNEVNFHPFGEQLGLQKLRKKATVVRVGNRIIRDAEQAAAEKRRVLRTIRRLTYS
jgi:hypothetical protein